MRLKNLLLGTVAVSAGALVYGCLVESNRLVLRRKTVTLKGWPRKKNGYEIAVLGDLHIRDEYSFELAKRAVNLALDANPDMIVLVGDFVGYWKDQSVAWLGEALEPLLLASGNVVAVPGNHDYLLGSPEVLEEILDSLNIKLLRNEVWQRDGIDWVGIDSANAGEADPIGAFEGASASSPKIVVWHEPDLNDWIPEGAALALSGHSHGGQFLTPWGQPFMGSKNGKRYRRGFYPEASTPVFVTAGVGTTGPPSRLFCPPEVVVLRLESA